MADEVAGVEVLQVEYTGPTEEEDDLNSTVNPEDKGTCWDSSNTEGTPTTLFPLPMEKAMRHPDADKVLFGINYSERTWGKPSFKRLFTDLPPILPEDIRIQVNNLVVRQEEEAADNIRSVKAELEKSKRREAVTREELRLMEERFRHLEKLNAEIAEAGAAAATAANEATAALVNMMRETQKVRAATTTTTVTREVTNTARGPRVVASGEDHTTPPDNTTGGGGGRSQPSGEGDDDGNERARGKRPAGARAHGRRTRANGGGGGGDDGDDDGDDNNQGPTGNGGTGGGNPNGSGGGDPNGSGHGGANGAGGSGGAPDPNRAMVSALHGLFSQLLATHASAPQPLVKPTLPKPKIFNLKMDVEDWWKALKRWLELTHVPEREWTSYLILYCKHNIGARILRMLEEKGYNPPTSAPWVEAAETVTRTYGDPTRSTRIAETLPRERQGADTAQDYIHRFDEKLSQIRRADRLAEWQVTRYFVQGFNSKSLREKLATDGMDRPIRDYTVCREKAYTLIGQNPKLYGGSRGYEPDAPEAHRPQGGRGRGEREVIPRSVGKKDKERGKEGDKSKGRPFKKRRPIHDPEARPLGKNVDKICYYCGKRGHVSAECFSNPKNKEGSKKEGPPRSFREGGRGNNPKGNGNGHGDRHRDKGHEGDKGKRFNPTRAEEVN